MTDSTASTLRVISFADAVLEAVSEAMETDPSVITMGVSVDDPVGTRGSTGLVEKFGRSRVIGTPLSEDGVTGIAIGVAMAGMRPLVVHGRVDFALLTMNSLINVAAKVRGMYGGAVGGVPLTMRATIGRSWGQGAQHSQGLGVLFAHIPGLRVVMPSTPADAKGAMAWALRESKDPTIFIDHRMLHKTTGIVPVGSIPGCDPKNGWRRRASGDHLTIVALSYMVIEAQRAVDHLRTLGITCSLFDPMWIRPLPVLPAVMDDVIQTTRLLVIDCGWPTYGFSAEVVASVAEGVLELNESARLGFAETVCSTAKSLENLYYPNAQTIAAKAYDMVKGKPMPTWDSKTGAPEIGEFRGPF